MNTYSLNICSMSDFNWSFDVIMLLASNGVFVV